MEYNDAPGYEETFEQFEERIEENMDKARRCMRDGQRDTALLDSELRSLQFKVFNENQTTVNQIRNEIESLVQSLRQQANQGKDESVFLERQMGQLKIENAQDQFFVRQMAVKEEVLSQAMGTDDDVFEVIPGYIDEVKNSKQTSKPWSPTITRLKICTK